MKKVASYLTLKNVDQSEFNKWLDSLPLRLRGGQRELLWLKSIKRKSIIWTSEFGFRFFE